MHLPIQEFHPPIHPWLNISGTLHFGFAHCHDAEEDLEESLIIWLVPTGVLSVLILHCQGQQDDPGKALWPPHLNHHNVPKAGSFPQELTLTQSRDIYFFCVCAEMGAG